MRLDNSLKLTARPEGGPPISILITFEQLKAAADRDVRGKLAKPKPKRSAPVASPGLIYLP